MPAFARILPHYTVADAERWEGLWELIDGIPYAMHPAPRFWHQLVQKAITRALDEALEHCPACFAVTTANYKASDDTLMIPDVMVVCTGVPEDGLYLTEPPALAVEVLSDSTALKDRFTKRDRYEREGVRILILADPDTHTLEVLQLQSTAYEPIYSGPGETHTLELGPCSVEVDFSAIWPT